MSLFLDLQAYLGEGMGPLSFLTDLKILHPGRVAGQFILKHTMPAVLEWVLGGNISHLEKSRVPFCRCELQALGMHLVSPVVVCILWWCSTLGTMQGAGI